MNKTSMRIAVTAAAVTVVLVTWIQSGTCLSVLGLEKPRAGGCMGLLRFLLGGTSDGRDGRPSPLIT